MKIQERKGVAPVIATLLMIAVAVAMSVIIFMWSQNFLSNTSTAAGSQQGSQNVAAETAISIESISSSDTTVTVYLRNVGAVSATVGNLFADGISSNAGFKGHAVATSVSACASLAKGTACSLTLTATGLVSGDTISVKATTTLGTFAQSQYTVP